ncbi:aminopeptidase N [Sporosarcina globispora]|uniref:Aminopeptidase N n=1 Tax=Sporosarcina globispora TaxID=1459 RepID=A0A0M0GCX5_SPOGL|nr:ABC transporter permease subunit [Sporosarcina globispora]KON87276.1 aminopeptidase N [Sporosarcina globispora]
MNKLIKINYSLIIGILMAAVLLFFCIFGPMLAPHSLTSVLETQYTNGKVLAPPLEPFESSSYPLGTDKWGYDLLSMILYGLRYTVFIAAAVTSIKMAFGAIIGLYAGILKRTPGWLIAFENAWSYVPLFLILYFFLSPISFNSNLKQSVLIGYFIVIASIISIPSIVSSVRLKTAELYKSVYIEAAKALGAGKHRLIWKHIFPQLKETFLVMFILEIVYVIALMGQLALLNIFVGGTIMRYDPIIYLSATKELAGLAGQARLNIYGNTHILIAPLAVLLLTTVSFSLLANGLKNRFQSNYQRTPWIKTGHEPLVQPSRKQYGRKKKFWSYSGPKAAFAALVIAFAGAGVYVVAAKNSNVGVKSGSRADYKIDLEMNSEGYFTVNADIEMKNQSNKEWNELVFYFIPNVFEDGHTFDSVEGTSEADITKVTVNGQKANYKLKGDTLTIDLKSDMKDKSKHKVKIEYGFTVPDRGSRFSKVGTNYYLAQWYPMAAVFQKGKWNKEPYMEGLETFHTGFSDFNVSYKLPEGYSLASTAGIDPAEGENEGTVKAKRVRDFFMAVMKDMKVYETEAKEGVKVRLFSRSNHDKDPEASLALAKKALTFYQDKIGEYPHEQLDIVLDEGQFMEYPGIVTINPYIDDKRFYEISIVHEIAHQYFYGVVANDPYNHAWVDEGITEFATSMYFYAGQNQDERQAFGISHYRMEAIEEAGLGRQYSNVPINEVKHSGFIYGQPALEIYEMIQEKYTLKGESPEAVGMQFLSDYYQKFRYKEVDTKEFIYFTKDYFSVPAGYFNNWIDTSKVNS